MPTENGQKKGHICPHCGQDYVSKQALWYHLHGSTSECRTKETAAREALEQGEGGPAGPATPPPVAADPPRNTIEPVNLNLVTTQIGDPEPPPLPPPKPAPAAAGAALVQPGDYKGEASDFEGDAPPVPIGLLFLILFLLAILGVILFSWQWLWKLYKKYKGGDQDAG